MQPFHVEGAVSLGAAIGNDGIIYLRMGGNLSEDNSSVVLEWAEKVREAMRECKARNPDRVLTLIEVLGAVEADARSVEILHELMRYNKDFATRTAVFGATFFIRQIVDMAIHVTHRTNMHQFETREEALVWLMQDGQSVPAQN